MTSNLSRRTLLTGAAFTAGAVALIRGGLAPSAARAQGALSASTVFTFQKAGATFHTYVSPAETVNVTAHVIELGDQLLVVDATMIPPTAAEVAALVATTGKPVHTAYISHEHPDHWGGVSSIPNVAFQTLPAIREAVRTEAAQGQFPEPTSLLTGNDLALGSTDIGGVSVEFRSYDNAEAPQTIVAVLPEQKVAVVQDLVYNGIYFAPGVDRSNWISVLEQLRDDPACETLLVGHGLPTSRGELDTAIAYLRVLDAAWDKAATPDEVSAAMVAAFPGYDGAFLLSLIPEYWDK